MLDALKRFVQPPVFPDNDDRTRTALTLDALLLFHLATVFVFGIPTLLVLGASLFEKSPYQNVIDNYLGTPD